MVVCTRSVPSPSRESLRLLTLPLLDGHPKDEGQGGHLGLPTAPHIRVDVGQLINLFDGCLGGGVQGDDHEVLDSWGAGKRQRSHRSPGKARGPLEGSGCPPRRHGCAIQAPVSEAQPVAGIGVV